MSEPQRISTVARELEARMLLEQEYNEEHIEDIMDIYRDVMKHIGFEDKRRDKRFIVKFHDIFYYKPRDLEDDEDARFNDLFNEFCNERSKYIEEELREIGIDVDIMLTRYNVGHYRAFELYIQTITQDNALDITKEIWGRFLEDSYASDYIYVVDSLQDLEDNYMEYWIEFLRDIDYPDAYIKQIEDAYNKDNNNNTTTTTTTTIKEK